jgi:hypothetical protein
MNQPPLQIGSSCLVRQYRSQITYIYRVSHCMSDVPSSELGLPKPLARKRVCPLPLKQKVWGHNRNGGGGSSNPATGEDTLPTLRYRYSQHFVDLKFLCHIRETVSGPLGFGSPSVLRIRDDNPVSDFFSSRFRIVSIPDPHQRI